MQMEKHKADIQESADQAEDSESLEQVLFQVSECYVYIIPPRKSAASYRADEWDVNKWAWEGTLKVISKGEECIIRLEDKKTGELYARAFLRNGEAHPVEPVIDSSRYFVLRVEENIGELLLPINPKFYNVKETPAGGDHADGRLRHAFIGMGLRERTEAYDFQAALHDHMKYLNKKKTAEEMEQQFKHTSSVDYSLKDGETLVLQIKNNKRDCSVKSKFFQQGLQLHSPSKEKGRRKEQPVLNIKLPPPPPAPTMTVSPLNSPTSLSLEKASIREIPITINEDQVHRNYPEEPSTQNVPDDDFGDFQTAV